MNYAHNIIDDIKAELPLIIREKPLFKNDYFISHLPDSFLLNKSVTTYLTISYGPWLLIQK